MVVFCFDPAGRVFQVGQQFEVEEVFDCCYCGKIVQLVFLQLQMLEAGVSYFGWVFAARTPHYPFDVAAVDN